MSNRICPKCGTSNPAEMSFCSNCGQTLNVPVENAPRRSEEPPPTVFMNQPTPTSPHQPVLTTPQISSNPPQPPKKSSKALMFGVIGCLGLLIVSVVGLVIAGFALGYGSDIFSKKEEPYRDFPTPTPKSNSNSVSNSKPVISDTRNTKKSDSTNTSPTNTSQTDDDSDSSAFLVTILEERKQVGSFNQTSAKTLVAKEYFPEADGAAQAEYSKGSKQVLLLVGKFSSPEVAKQNFNDQIKGVKSGGGKVTYENTADDGTISAIYTHKNFYFAEYCNTNSFCNRILSSDQATLKSFLEDYAK